MVRTLVSPAVQPAAIAEVDVGTNPSRANTAKSEEQSSGQTESPSLAVPEGPLADIGNVNRIARWMDDSNPAPAIVGAGVADKKHRVNGHDARERIRRGSE